MTELSAIPKDISGQINCLKRSIEILHAYWKLFADLFASGNDKIDLLNQSASTFFVMVSFAFRERVVLGIARLLDPPRTIKQDNLVLERIINDLRPIAEPALVSKLERHLNALRKDRSIIEYRHKRIAHSDLKVSLKVTPAPSVTTKDIDHALNILSHFMNLIHVQYENKEPHGYRHIVIPNGVLDLEAHLMLGVAAIKYKWRPQLTSWTRSEPCDT